MGTSANLIQEVVQPDYLYAAFDKHLIINAVVFIFTWRRNRIDIHLTGSGRLDNEAAATGWHPGLATGGHQWRPGGGRSPAIGHNKRKGPGGVSDGLHARVSG